LALSVAQKQSVVQNLQQLRRQGHSIWLDDIDEVLISSFLSCRLPLSGIKIDKEAFWRLRATPALRQLVSLCFQLAGKVLIEGIETERDHLGTAGGRRSRPGVLLAVLDMAGGLKSHFQEETMRMTVRRYRRRRTGSDALGFTHSPFAPPFSTDSNF
jgi:hypothetical protein